MHGTRTMGMGMGASDDGPRQGRPTNVGHFSTAEARCSLLNRRKEFIGRRSRGCAPDPLPTGDGRPELMEVPSVGVGEMDSERLLSNGIPGS